MKKVFCFILTMVVLSYGTAFTINQPVKSGQAISNKIYASNNPDVSFKGGTNIETIEETINYAYKIEDEYFNPYKVPGYLSQYTCGISAGGVAIGYYDKTYDELIPNHTGKIFLGKYLWAPQGTAVDSMYDNLYTKMNATSEGVTIDGYLGGVSSYVSSRGRSVLFTKSMASIGQLNSSQYKTALQNDKLLSIFIDGFSIIDYDLLRTYDGYDVITTDISRGAHIMVAFGYLDISYYNSSNQCFRKDSYIHVNTGFSTPALALVKLNQHCVIDDCYVTEIY